MAESRPFCSAVVVAAGLSSRMGEDKILAGLAGVPVIIRTLSVFEKSPFIDEIVVVTRRAAVTAVEELCAGHGIRKLRSVAEGGESRAESVLRGLRACSDRCVLAAVHDGARPLVTEDIIGAAVEAAAESGAAAPGIPVCDTLRRAENGVFTDTVDRSGAYRMQTPQVFRRDIITEAVEYALRSGIAVTDDCEAAMLMGVKVRLTPGSEENIKLTTPADMRTASAIIDSRR